MGQVRLLLQELQRVIPGRHQLTVEHVVKPHHLDRALQSPGVDYKHHTTSCACEHTIIYVLMNLAPFCHESTNPRRRGLNGVGLSDRDRAGHIRRRAEY